MHEVGFRCPACAATLEVERLSCPTCHTAVEGRFCLCPLCRAGGEERDFALTFLRCRGSIKEVERALGISYPTVRARLEELLARLEAPPAPDDGMVRRVAILEDLRDGRIAQDEALRRLTD